MFISNGSVSVDCLQVDCVQVDCEHFQLDLYQWPSVHFEPVQPMQANKARAGRCRAQSPGLEVQLEVQAECKVGGAGRAQVDAKCIQVSASQ